MSRFTQSDSSTITRQFLGCEVSTLLPQARSGGSLCWFIFQWSKRIPRSLPYLLLVWNSLSFPQSIFLPSEKRRTQFFFASLPPPPPSHQTHHQKWLNLDTRFLVSALLRPHCQHLTSDTLLHSNDSLLICLPTCSHLLRPCQPSF